MLEVKQVDNSNRQSVVDLIADHWGSSIVVTRGKVHHAKDLDGFAVYENSEMVGLITYHIVNNECEIVSLDSMSENRGIGTMLIEKVTDVARKHGCRRVWLITTNDNTHAIRFYQRRGFNMAALHVNAIEESRKIKPQIPLYGFDGIPIMHEVEFEKIL
ncbi:MAG: GNAT family N-acetyltransferase [Acetivibrionales bacterium]|jgi:ribosomal protein S18 acetylase RimI-like enzyme|nr:GNAT family N-acetyltransferase [Clostridiaceae bacterium]